MADLLVGEKPVAASHPAPSMELRRNAATLARRLSAELAFILFAFTPSRLTYHPESRQTVLDSENATSRSNASSGGVIEQLRTLSQPVRAKRPKKKKPSKFAVDLTAVLEHARRSNFPPTETRLKSGWTGEDWGQDSEST
jgi:hypothetical protein